MSSGVSLFVLHALRTNLLPQELIRIIVQMCEQEVLQRCDQCMQELMMLKRGQLAPTGVRYYVLNDRCLCEDCSGIRAKYTEFVRRQRELGIDTNYLCGLHVNHTTSES